MFPGKAGHSRGLRPASYGSAERSRVRRHLRFPGSSSPTRSGVTAPGLGHRRTAVRHPASCLRPGPARRVPWRRIRARTTRWRTRSRASHPAPARALRASAAKRTDHAAWPCCRLPH